LNAGSERLAKKLKPGAVNQRLFFVSPRTVKE
jgi:hypothetical protein